jgi:hypothetical protein
MRQNIRIAIHIILAAICVAGSACAKPGPTVSGFSQRVEYHSKTENSNSANFGNELYMYNMLFMARQIDEGMIGTLSYIHQYAMRDEQTIADIANVSLSQRLTPNWKTAYSYTFVDLNSRAANAQVKATCSADSSGTSFYCPESKSDWIGLSVEYNTNPGYIDKHTIKASLSYNTTTDFSESKSLVPKLLYQTRINNRYDWEVAYQMIYNLKATATVDREITANQYFLTFGIKPGVLDKVQLQYVFSDNTYNGNPGNDNIFRVNYNHMFKRKR